MREKKYIDRLYQEKFRDFEAAPRDAVWEALAKKLKEDQKRPVVAPLWTRLGGVAAILAFLVLIGDWILPRQTGPSIATEDIELPRATEPLQQLPYSPLRIASEVIPSEENFERNNQIASVDRKAIPEVEQNDRIAKTAASEIIRESIIFDTPAIKVGSIKTKAEEEALQPDRESLLDEIKAAEETEIVATKPKNNFEISTHAAPIYYGNLGGGSFLDPRFNNNSSESEVTYSYGINIAYNVSDKIKIRSGINRVNMSHNTNGVAYQSIAGAAPLKNVSLENAVAVTPPPGGPTSGRKPVGGTIRNPAGYLTPGSLNQKMGYLEVPLELEYNLLASKFEINLIGGASTLFLEENEVTLNAEAISAEGRANNLNQVSFSTNIGLGLDYNLSEKFQLNVEPMFKYQLNTFEDSSRENRPYYFGIYSGFSFKF